MSAERDTLTRSARRYSFYGKESWAKTVGKLPDRRPPKPLPKLRTCHLPADDSHLLCADRTLHLLPLEHLPPDLAKTQLCFSPTNLLPLGFSCPGRSPSSLPLRGCFRSGQLPPRPPSARATGGASRTYTGQTELTHPPSPCRCPPWSAGARLIPWLPPPRPLPSQQTGWSFPTASRGGRCIEKAHGASVGTRFHELRTPV